MAETDKIVFGTQPFQFPVGYILMSANNINPATQQKMIMEKKLVVV